MRGGREEKEMKKEVSGSKKKMKSRKKISGHDGVTFHHEKTV